MYEVSCEVPAGCTRLTVEFDYVAPTTTEGFTAAASCTAKLAFVDWHLHLLYPKGRPAAEYSFAASVKLPPHWSAGGALKVVRREGDTIEFATLPLDRLVDSPVVAGLHYRNIDLTPSGGQEHQLDVVGDSAAAVDLPDELREGYAQLVLEARALFGATHYEKYHFLVTLSDHVSHFGLEHHECSDNREGERFFMDEDAHAADAGLLPHEFVHSWNGKFRRPAGLATADYQAPMRGELLWVYEGLTEYLGNVLTARCGFYSPEQYRDNLARVAAGLESKSGRRWRPLQDTCDAAQVLYSAPSDSWSNWRRGTDFYDEGELIWLEADVLIRTKTNGKKSLDDFCRLFLGGESGPAVVRPYQEADVYAALRQVVDVDWQAFFRERLSSTSPHAPLGGLAAAGWKLVFSEETNELEDLAAARDETLDLHASLGMTVGKDAAIGELVRDGPVDKAGVPAGAKLVAVNGRKFSPQRLVDAITAARGVGGIELLVESQEFYSTFRIDYRDGMRHPHLERDPSKPDLLEQIVRPKVEAPDDDDDDSNARLGRGRGTPASPRRAG